MIYDLGNGYYVEPLGLQHLDGPYPRWFMDQDVCRHNRHGKFSANDDALRAFLAAANTDGRIDWAIHHDEAGHVGNVSLSELSFIDRSADFGILIGDRSHNGRGVGQRAGRALFMHAFSKLNLERIACGTAATNLGMIRLAAKLGMIQEGRRRAARYLDGEWVDVLEFGLLRSEFRLSDVA